MIRSRLEQQVNELWMEADKNKDGLLSFEELLAHMENHSTTFSEEQSIAAKADFEMKDENHDGNLT